MHFLPRIWGFRGVGFGRCVHSFFSWEPSVVFLNLKRVTWLNTGPFGFFDLCDIPQKPSPEASTQASLRDAWQQTTAPEHCVGWFYPAYWCGASGLSRTLLQHRSALCITRNMNVIIPPHPTPPINVALRTDVSVREHYINIAVRCASRVTWTLSSHPTPPHETMIYVVKNAQKHAVPIGKAHKKVRGYRSTEPPTNITGGPHLTSSIYHL